MSQLGLRRVVLGVFLSAGVIVPSGDVHAIRVDPTEEEIARALSKGKAAAEKRVPPDRLYVWFGSSEPLEPHGFLMTKLAGVSVMASHFALRGETPSRQDIERILGSPTLLISVVIFGDRADFALDSYLLLVQGDRTIKPASVRFDGRAARTMAWPNAPAFRARVVAAVPYADLDPEGRTRIAVFPGSGGELSFHVNFGGVP